MLQRLYISLIQFFPFEYQALFATEIAEVFAGRLATARKQGRMAGAAFAVREILALLASVREERRIQQAQGVAYLSHVQGPKRLQWLIRNMEHAIAHHDFVRARQCAVQLDSL
jgi:hypothetical protein